VVRRTGLKAAEIRELAAVGAIELTTQDGVQWLEETAVRIAELWAKLRETGFTPRLGFRVKSLAVYVEFVRWLAREELRLFTGGVTGKVGRDRSVRMAEAGITYMNQIIGLLRKATLLRSIAQAADDRGRRAANAAS
jgi:hypothetical protein